MGSCRQRLSINGIVQGVGFRPFVYRLARQCNLSGFVNNNSTGVCVEIQGDETSIEVFHEKLRTEAPPFAKIISVEKENIDRCADSDFIIKESDSKERAHTLISPDISICDNCLEELFDPHNRRYHYPFINCTNCGPRYSIIKTIPYDRPYTSMADFVMCPECQKEYNDPLDRRFHAQPNACPQCGPQLKLQDKNGNKILSKDLIDKAAELIANGNILAIRGLGGFHLAADPFNTTALEKLRMRKGRQAKPFALMARNTGVVEKYCYISEFEKQCLQQPTNPIVILKALEIIPLSSEVAPGNNYLAFMLPYTPLHHLLMQHFDVLVMTSANFTDEPIAIANEESFERLQNIADYFLSHNREILQRCDDSIVRVVDNRQRMIRRARGYVPAPVFIKENTEKNILAVGGELKNTIALSRGKEVYFSQHIGDLDNPQAYNFFEDSISHLQDILQINADLIVCDMHPEYLSRKWAVQQNLPVIEVQHHHAHLAAVLAENHIDEPVIGIILDGTGYGTDGTIWGGEVLLGDTQNFERYAWLDPVALPGSGAAINEPWRMAYSYLKKAFGTAVNTIDLPLLNGISHNDLLILDQMIEKKLNAPLTSSCGRLFDAVSAILGICKKISYEAQAAIELEMFADAQYAVYYDKVIAGFSTFSENLNMDDLIRHIVRDYQNKQDISEIVSGFHNTLAEIFTRVAEEISVNTKINKVALSGGVFQNVYLFNTLNQKLKHKKFQVITQSQVPANDGGLALGQIVIASRKLKNNKL